MINVHVHAPVFLVLAMSISICAYSHSVLTISLCGFNSESEALAVILGEKAVPTASIEASQVSMTMKSLEVEEVHLNPVEVLARKQCPRRPFGHGHCHVRRVRPVEVLVTGELQARQRQARQKWN